MSDHDSHISADEERTGSPLLLILGLLFLLFLVVAGSLFLVHSGSPTADEDSARAAVRMKNLADLQAADTALLTSYGWIDQAKGIVHIPITRAMELVLPTLNAPVETPPPAPLPPAPPLPVVPTTQKP